MLYELDLATQVNRIAYDIENCTDRNDHTGAALALACFVGGKYTHLLEAISTIHEHEGHMPYNVGQYRHSLVSEMLTIVGNKHGEEIYNKLKSAF